MCELHVEDFDLHLDDEHVRLHGKGSSARTVLLDDRDLRPVARAGRPATWDP
ncbi:hypothetical protein [Nocardia gipuzkoensis]